MAVLIVLVVLVAAAVGGFVALRSSADTTTAVDAGQLADRADAAGSSTQDRGARPAPGVYEYAGSGVERVSVLGGSTHEFGPTVPAVLELGDGCRWTLEINFAKERRSTYTFCTEADGVQLVSSKDDVTFFGTTDSQVTTCDGAVRSPDGDGDTRAYTCTGDERSTAHELTFRPLSSARVGDEVVEDALTFTDVGTVTGVTRGTTRSTWTIAPDGLPLAFTESSDVRSDSLLGETDYELTGEWKLASLTPE